MSCAREELLDEVRIVHLDGCANDDDLRRSMAALGDHTGPTILDLTDLTLVGGELDRFIGRLIDSCDAVCVVARRHTARVILQRSGAAGRCAVFSSVADALQSLRLAHEGYGSGWSQASGAGA
ncbi:MAG TPA: hypothetical protein VFU14_08490 [Acidimicrobiales bacterium]|nr:hypothetical protein [Acidimicrobiales bacterium]